MLFEVFLMLFPSIDFCFFMTFDFVYHILSITCIKLTALQPKRVHIRTRIVPSTPLIYFKVPYLEKDEHKLNVLFGYNVLSELS